MYAARYIGNGTLEVVETSPAEPSAGEVQLDVAYTGICGTDLHILHGAMDARVSMPAVLGHEMAGRVASIGEGVEGWQIGDAATVMPLVSCGDCAACASGASHICYRLSFLGIDAPGSMQSRWNVPASVLVRLPDHLSLQTASLAEPTAVAVHDVRRAALADGERAVVVGAGPIGLLIATVARSAGADVAVFEPNAGRREIAAAVGLVAVDPLEHGTAAWVDDWTAGAGADVAFEVSGKGGRHEFRDRLPGGTRTGGGGGYSPVAAARRPLPRVLARADADRCKGVRTCRLRGSRAAARNRRDPERRG